MCVFYWIKNQYLQGIDIDPVFVCSVGKAETAEGFREVAA